MSYISKLNEIATEIALYHFECHGANTPIDLHDLDDDKLLKLFYLHLAQVKHYEQLEALTTLTYLPNEICNWENDRDCDDTPFAILRERALTMLFASYESELSTLLEEYLQEIYTEQGMTAEQDLETGEYIWS